MLKQIKKLSTILLLGTLLVGCAGKNSSEIHVISRETGSGTRTAFVDILKVIDNDEDDATTLEAVVQNSTNSVMQLVAGDKNAVGYMSLGSLNDSVKPLAIDGVDISAETIQSGQYPLSREFLIAWSKGQDLAPQIQDFLKFVYAKQGQTLVQESGYVPVLMDGAKSLNELPDFTKAADVKGGINVVGSTSVTPIIEKLAEAYHALNPHVTVSITSNGSSAGIEAAKTNTADLGISSRDLTADELKVLECRPVAADGLAVIVNKENTIQSISLTDLRKVFLGEITDWTQVK